MDNAILFTGSAFNDLVASLRQVVKEELSNVSSIANSETGYISRREAAKRLNVSLPTLSELTKRGNIPGYRIGNKVLYKPAELMQAGKKVNAGK